MLIPFSVAPELLVNTLGLNSFRNRQDKLWKNQGAYDSTLAITPQRNDGLYDDIEEEDD